MTDLLGHVEEQSAALAAAVERSPEAPVPACPGWTVVDVAAHVGRVHRLFTAAVRLGLTDRPGSPADAPGGPALADWLRAGAADLVAVLAAADPKRPVWNWTGTPEPPAWVTRRMAHETAVHRWDAAAGVAAVAGVTPEPLPGDLAADGIDEFVDVMLAHRTDPWVGPAVGVALERSDGPQRWLVRPEVARPGVTVERGEAPGGLDADAVVRAGASDLLLLLWRRLGPGDVEVAGDLDRLGRLLAWARL